MTGRHYTHRQAIAAHQNIKEKAYWLDKLSGKLVKTGFPYDYNPTDAGNGSRGAVKFRFSNELYSRLMRISNRTPHTLHIILTAGIVLLIDKYTYKGSKDIIVGAPIYRQETDARFINTVLALRNRVERDMTFKELLLQVRQTIGEADKHQNFPIEILLQQLNLEPHGSGFPLFDVAVLLEPIHDKTYLGQVNPRMTFCFASSGESLEGVVEYNSRLYRETTVQRIAGHLRTLLNEATAAVDKKVKDIDILTPEEKERLLSVFNDNAADFSRDKTACHLIRQQAVKIPAAIALGFENHAITYRELDKRAQRLAGALLAFGVGIDEPVGILMDRSPRMVESILAVWKSRGAYIPIDTQYPCQRITGILTDSRGSVLITESQWVTPGLANEYKGNIIPLDTYFAKNRRTGRTGPDLPVHGNSLAYIIYTSGSTGKPKGAVIEHRGMMNHIRAKIEDLHLTGQSIAAQNAHHCFDISVWQFFAALTLGGKTVIYPHSLVMEPQGFMDRVINHGVTVLEVVPSYLSLMLSTLEPAPGNFGSLVYLLVTGEVVKPALVKQWFEKYPGIKVVNAYGPTEASDDITHFIMDKAPETERIPIGKSLRNFNITIVDRDMKLCPVGVSGEICVSGVGVGRGYLNNPQLTSEKFIPLPLNSKHPTRYRTGDLGRWLPDGNVDFLGRIDEQVKIRGFRIECGEIENTLLTHPRVNDVVVAVREDKHKARYLAAYLTGAGAIDSTEIRQYLEQLLPAYMIPGYFVQLDRLPLTANGKVDKKALPEPGNDGTSTSPYQAPVTETEAALAEIWQEVLGIEPIGIFDNFFGLGGDSIKGIRIVGKIQERLGEILHIARIFEAPTIKALAADLDRYKKQDRVRIDAGKLAAFREILPRLSPLKTAAVKNPPAVFILSSPRTGSTLLRVILAGHPGIFAPPELELLLFETLQERKAELSGPFSYFAEGATRALMEIEGCGPEQAKAQMEELEAQNLTVKEFYGKIQQRLGDKLLVDKTANYALSPGALKRAEDYFASPRYIHLTRHPYAVIRSYKEAKLDQVFRYKHHFSPSELAELVWLVSEQHIKEFLKGVPGDRKRFVKFEELVEKPDAVVRGICEFLRLPFEKEMLQVYKDTDKKMTGGIYAESRMIGDVKFFRHSTIDAGVAGRWKSTDLLSGDFLGDDSIQMALSLGYLIGSPGLEYAVVESAPALEYYPLSHAQKRLWILDQLQSGQTAYNITAAYSIAGALNREALERAFETIIQRHESLRTVFVSVDGEPKQKIRHLASSGFRFEYIDLREKRFGNDNTRDLADQEAATPFNLAEGPLVRIKLIHPEEGKYLFILTMHHIISDGWSMGMLVKEVLNLYHAYKEGEGNPLSPLKIQYKDYAVWQNSEKTKEILQHQGAYWKEQFPFAGDIPLLDLPTDFSRPQVQDFLGSHIHFQVGAAETRALKELALQEDATLYMVLLAVFNIFLSRLSGQDRIVVGMPVEGRGHEILRQIIGMFVNTLVLINSTASDKSFKKLLKEIKQGILGALENQDYPYEELTERLAITPDPGHNPLFDVMFVLHNADVNTIEIPGLTLTPYRYRNKTSKFDLTLGAAEREGNLSMGFEYRTRLFKESTIKRFSEFLRNTIASVLENPGIKIGEIEIISGEEKKRVLYDFNDTNAGCPNNKTIPRLFPEQVEQTPDRIALIGRNPKVPGGGVLSRIQNSNDQSLKQEGARGLAPLPDIISITYRKLHEKSDQLAYLLIEKGVQIDTIVGIMVERSIEMIIGIMGILKAGGAYLPIDPCYPRERIDYMLKDSGANILLTAHEIAGFSLPKVSNGPGAPHSPQGASIRLHRSPWIHTPVTSLAYVIYTSGSTGRPKGVPIESYGFVNLVSWYIKEFELTASDKFLLIAPIGFDLAQKNLFAPLITGACLCLAPPGIPDYEELSDLIALEKPVVINCAPSVFYPLLGVNAADGFKRLASLAYLFLGGEPIRMERLLPWLKAGTCGCKIVNTYGPTEGTDVVSYYRIDREGFIRQQPGTVPLGKPIYNVTLYILDKNRGVQPVGLPGELCIAGLQVGRGYLNNPDLTNEKFVEQVTGAGDRRRWGTTSNRKFLEVRKPFFKKVFGPRQGRIYKTGDLARWLTDGNIEFLGRIDYQVKIRGVRIELEEIEKQLLKHGWIKETAVALIADESRGNYLCAYIVTHSTGFLEDSWDSDLKDYLSGHFPGYMIPSFFVKLANMPLTPSGKIDRKGLPVPGLPAKTGYSAPTNEVEEKLVKIWSEILGTKKEVTGIDANFFELGGHSLKATMLASKIHKELNVKMPLAEIFRHLTIRKLAAFLEGNVENRYVSIEPVEKKQYYALSSAQKRLYILQQMTPESTAYNMPLVLTLEQDIPKGKLDSVFKKLVARHENLRTFFEMRGGDVVQRVHDEIDFEIESLHSGHAVFEDFIRPFDLGAAPHLRVGVVKTGEKHLLLVDMHHIVSDEISMKILENEFMALYWGDGQSLPAVKLQYKEYTQWQHSKKQRQSMKHQEQYWLTMFAGELPVLNLPTDYMRPVVQSFEGGQVEFSFTPGETGALKQLVDEVGVTLYMALLAIFNILLSRLGAQEDIIVGTPIAGRPHADLEVIIGMFVNTLAVRNYPSGEKTFLEFLSQVKARTLDAIENQDYQFEELVEKLNVTRNTGRNPIFDVLFNFLDRRENKKGVWEGDEENNDQYKKNSAKFDWNLRAFDDGQKLFFNWQYCTKLFKKDTIDRVIGYFRKIINDITSNPGIKISDIDITPGDTRKKELDYFNEDIKETAAIAPLQVVLANRFQKYKANIAMEYGSIQVTYGELERRAVSVCQRIIGSNIPRGSFIGIYIDDKIDMISVIMGILQARCVFIPLDTGLPVKQTAYMLQTTDIQIIFTDEGNEKILSPIRENNPGGFTIFVINLSFYQHQPGFSNNQQEIGYHGEDKAYVYFTSGTTAAPNAIIGKNDSLAQFIRWEIDTFDVDETDRFSQLAPVGFDAFLRNVFTPLCAGGTVCIPESRDLVLDGPGLVNWIDKNRITFIHCVPGVFRLISGETVDVARFAHLKYILLAGEPVNPGELRRWYNAFADRIQLVNCYGATEVTLFKTFHFIEKKDIEMNRIPVGKPIRGARVIILDRHMKVCDRGMVGEIYIRTPYRTYGYLNAPELHAQRFIKNPFGSNQDDIIYKTGDLGRQLENGEIEVFGRIDRQVKIRGVRIELESIENCLSKHDKIDQSVIINRKDEYDENYLCAYIVQKRESQSHPENFLNPAELRKYLAHRLPGYMIPSYFVTIERIPITPNGKLDMRKLPKPKVGAAGSDYTAPRNQAEQELAELWSEVLSLKHPNICIDNNFFAIGGHSLKAAVLAAKIHKAFHVKVPLAEIFRIPTIRGLSEYIQSSAKNEYAAVQPVEKKEYYGLSPAQRRLYILQRMTPKSTAYNMSQIFALEGADNDTLQERFRQLIKRHESLRTSLSMVGDDPVQRVHHDGEFEIEYYTAEDLVQSTEDLEQPPGSYASIIQDFIRPFNLSRAPLLRVGVIKTRQTKYLMVVDMHHIISDGISHTILARDFFCLYKGKKMPTLRLQYKDFSIWQNSKKQRESLIPQETYWLKQFEGDISTLDLPTDYLRPSFQSFEGNRLDFKIEEKKLAALKKLALEHGASLFMILLTVYAILLSKLSNREEMVMGTPAAGRRHADLEQVIGMFVNTLALRAYPARDKTCGELLKEVKKTTLEAFENQEYPFEELVDKVVTNRDTSRNPLFDVMFVLQNMEQQGGEAPELTLKPYQYKTRRAKFDITWYGVELEDSIGFSVEYCTGLFKTETIQRFISYFKMVVWSVIEKPEQKLRQIEILPADEKKKILAEFNITRADYTRGKTLPQLIAGQMGRTPDGIALAAADRQITYRTLDTRSNRLARVMNRTGIQKDHLVGILLNRSPVLAECILATWKTGGAYLPLAPADPRQRITKILKDADAKVLLTGAAYDDIEIGSGFDGKIFNLEKEIQTIGRENTDNPGFAISRHDLAYVIYTSGSTGEPKGVMIDHKGMMNHIQAKINDLQLGDNSIIVQNASHTFDISVWQFFTVMATGGKTIIYADELIWKPDRLISRLKTDRVTILEVVPSYLSMMLDSPGLKSVSLQHLEYLLVTGEELKPSLVKRWFEMYPGIKMVNAYGPTEASDDITHAIMVTPPETAIIPIGKPLQNMNIYIVDKCMKLVPVGVKGEIYVSGIGVGRGYLNDPELTAKKFDHNFWDYQDYQDEEKKGTNKKSHMSHRSYISKNTYRTGDLARWSEDGNIEFLGRIDQQVKIRGNRIELGEIEKHLLTHPLVKEAVVIVRKEEKRYLSAYIVAQQELEVSELREYLSEQLPHYMIPSYITRIEKLPLTPNGKIDRKSLPPVQLEFHPQLKGTDAAPGTDLEKIIAIVWQEVLKLEKIGIHHNFFELGGNSLDIIKVNTRLKQVIGKDIPVITMFEYTTIRSLSHYLGEKETGERNSKKNIHPFEAKNISKNKLRQKKKRMTGE